MAFLGRIREGLSRTTQQIAARFDDLVRASDEGEKRSRPIDVDTLDALEELLISADVGMAATGRIIAAVRTRARNGQGLRDLVKHEIQRGVRGRRSSDRRRASSQGDPRRRRERRRQDDLGREAREPVEDRDGEKPLICAADTFRAAAVEQLDIWAKRAGVDLVRAREGTDPAAVVFDAITSGKAKGRDPILVDTAGRLHTRVNLMNELDKIRRIAAREVDGAPQEVLLVLDATVGQNGVTQAREFTNVAGVNGIVLTKLDGTAKGGVAVADRPRLEAANPLRRRRRSD